MMHAVWLSEISEQENVRCLITAKMEIAWQDDCNFRSSTYALLSYISAWNSVYILVDDVMKVAHYSSEEVYIVS